VTLGQGAHAVLARDVLGPGTGHGGLDVEVSADGLQARGVEEAGQVDLPDLLGLSVPVDAHAEDLTVGADFDVGHVLGNRDADGLARAGDDLLGFPVVLEGAVAGVGSRTVRQRHPEEALTLHGHVVRVVGLLQRALRELPLGRGCPHAHADLGS